MRLATVLTLLALLTAGLSSAATLEKLSLVDMSQKATAVVRAQVLDSHGQQHGALIYTHYRLQISEWWKGTGPATLDVVVPGGVAGGMRQTFSGSPKLSAGAEHVLFLWKSPSGLTHIVGLTQGLFHVEKDSSGELMATRGATNSTMVDRAGGRLVPDEPVRYRLNDLRQQVVGGAR